MDLRTLTTVPLDVYKRQAQFFQQSRAAFQHILPGSFKVPGIPSVSYTHLDVYKRQGQHCLLEGRATEHRAFDVDMPIDQARTDIFAVQINFFPAMIRTHAHDRISADGNISGVDLIGKHIDDSCIFQNPVSYTHLDVYKRQVLICATQFSRCMIS